MSGIIRLKSIKKITAGGSSAENVLGFREAHVMNMTPQFVPNLFKGVDVLEKAKFRRLVITFDSDTNIFDNFYTVIDENAIINTVIRAEFWIADNTGDFERWTYTISKGYVEKKEFGRIEDGVRRSTFEYSIICYGTRVISKH